MPACHSGQGVTMVLVGAKNNTRKNCIHSDHMLALSIRLCWKEVLKQQQQIEEAQKMSSGSCRLPWSRRITYMMGFLLLFAWRNLFSAVRLDCTSDNSTNILSQLQQLQLLQFKGQAARVQHRSSLDYVESFRDIPDNSLRFIHIPKAAGSTITIRVGVEHLAVPWGHCLFAPLHIIQKHYTYREECRGTFPAIPSPTQQQSAWHIPPYFFPIQNTHPYQEHRTFAVVRDPVDRALSEYYFRCMDYPVLCGRKHLKDPDTFIQFHLKQYYSLLQQENINATTTEGDAQIVERYLQRDAHWVPQLDYIIFGPLQVRLVDIVLRTDQLHDQMQQMAKAFSWPPFPSLHYHDRINASPRNGTAVNSARRQQQEDLAPETISLLLKYYTRDFELLASPKSLST